MVETWSLSTPDTDPTVPEEATVEPHILSDEEEDERAARREEQQEHSTRTLWPDADYPLRQAGESSPAPGKRHR
ncbi:MAG TPA: hypothetical protein VKQ32_12080 [Polyangia bacterium]|nr:hypothetical protein [Polyangia bacterium]